MTQLIAECRVNSTGPWTTLWNIPYSPSLAVSFTHIRSEFVELNAHLGWGKYRLRIVTDQSDSEGGLRTVYDRP